MEKRGTRKAPSKNNKERLKSCRGFVKATKARRARRKSVAEYRRKLGGWKNDNRVEMESKKGAVKEETVRRVFAATTIGIQ